jgi:O-methyltransferase involved in polyketide biosynthesis
MQGSEIFDLNFDAKDFWFWIRVMHFESRYWSIDRLLEQTNCKNILELSSGYSFRGLDICTKDKIIHYIDTDLPAVVAVKQGMIAKLKLDNNVKGKFETVPLNTLDESEFKNVVNRFGPGPLAIVNEGLLMYLNAGEKKQLCTNIQDALKQRGGCWITADVYVKRSAEMMASLPQSQSEVAFMEQHHIEENKFESYEAARSFFEEQGFEIVKEAALDFQKLSATRHLMKVLPEEIRNSKKPPPKIQATWMLNIK